MSHEWDAEAYHRLSDPQFRWGTKVLARVPLRGDERALDAGCGSGRLTGLLLERLPRGHVVAVDRSTQMLEQAAAHLEPRFGERVSFVSADLATLVLERPVDLIFSTATFHWIRDHQRLFETLHRALAPNGFLVAQCGGAGNLARILARAERHIARTPTLAEHLAGFTSWEFADAAETRARLEHAGFVDIETSLEDEPTPFEDAATFDAFITKVVFRTHLEQLPTPELQREFITAIVAESASDDPPYTLDYVRLNLRARRPNPRAVLGP
jgi:trans-aconitate 2-methyltransferase